MLHKRPMDHVRTLLVSAAFVLGSLIGGIANADESVIPDGKCQANSCNSGVPLLTKVPYVGRLFRNVGTAHEQCVNDEIPMLGISLGFCRECPSACASNAESADCSACCALSGCCAAIKSNQSQCGVKADSACCAKQKAACCAAGNAACKALAPCETKAARVCRCPGKCCGDRCNCPVVEETAKITACDAASKEKRIVRHFAAVSESQAVLFHEEIASLAAENSALQATLESQEAFFEQQMEMLEHFAELESQKTQLEAELAMQAERDEMTQKVLEFATENLRLKGQIELAEAKAEFAQQLAAAKNENDSLKRELARLEWKAPTEAEARVSTRSTPRKKAR